MMAACFCQTTDLRRRDAKRTSLRTSQLHYIHYYHRTNPFPFFLSCAHAKKDLSSHAQKDFRVKINVVGNCACMENMRNFTLIVFGRVVSEF
jgi:hypothetical protein